MALVAQLKPSWDTSSRAQFAAAWQENATSLVVITDIDAGNVDPAKVVVTDPSSSTPNVFVDYRSATGGWRHLMWAVEGAEGKRPVFDLNRSSRVTPSTPGTGWGILWTQDFVTWTKSPYPTLIAGTPNKLRCQFTDPLPAGRVYIATQPMHPEGHSAILAASLLENYPSICSPTASANAYGVFNVSPAETDDLGRQVGGRNQYAVKLSWPGPTTDGHRKRVMVMMSGIHAAGEGNASVAHRAALEWMLESASAEAVAFRANWDVYTYFNLTPNGYYGGHNRANFRNGTDPNRAWAGTTLAEINAIKAAIPVDLGLDAGGHWDAMYAWHAYYVSSSDFQCWVTPNNAGISTRSPIMQAMVDAGSNIFTNAPVFSNSGTLNTDVWWAETQGAVVSFDTELQQNGNMDPQFFKDVASKWMRTLVAVDSDGWFVPAATSSISNSVSSGYAVRVAILQSTSADYTISSSIPQDKLSIYSVRQEVEKDVVSSYVVEAAVGVVSNEISSEYIVRSSVAEDRLSLFNVRSFVFDEKVGTYSVLDSVFKDNTSVFGVKESILAEVLDEYNILSVVFEDVVGSFNALSVVSSGVTSSYEVVSASTVSATASGSYVIRNPVLSSNENTYFVRDVISVSSEGSYVVRDVAFQETDDTFFIRSVISQTAEDDYFVVGLVGKDVSSSYEILSDKTPVGNSATSGYIIFNSVSGDIISYYNVFGGFAVVKRYNVTLNKENVFNITLQ